MKNRDEVEGQAENLKGRIKEAAGTLTGNPKLENEGADQRAAARSRRGSAGPAARSAKRSRTSEKMKR